MVPGLVRSCGCLHGMAQGTSQPRPAPPAAPWASPSRAPSSLRMGMFAGGLKEMEQEEVLIHGVSYNAMCQILHFIYTSELELSLSNVQETLVAACQLQVRLRPEVGSPPFTPATRLCFGFNSLGFSAVLILKRVLPGVMLPSARPTASWWCCK